MTQKALHGTVHTFLQFDLDFAGSGEGAASYGHGIYVTNSQEVAQTYAGIQPGGYVPAIYLVNGARTKRGTPLQKAADLVYSAGVSKALKLATEMVQDARAGLEWTLHQGLPYYEKVAHEVARIGSKRHIKLAQGRVMEVEIPPAQEMLDWGLPLAKQPGPISQGCRGALAEARGDELSTPTAWQAILNMSGHDVYQALTDAFSSQVEASNTLRKHGVKGIRYSSPTSATVENHVVFSDKDIKVLWTYEKLKALQSQTDGEISSLIQSKRRDSVEFVEAEAIARMLRTQIYAMTGHPYGYPKPRLQKPDDDALNATYEHPDDVPADVMAWERSRSCLYADATDAQRWARIVDTADHDRFDTAEMVIYRAICESDDCQQIRPGDWVTPDLAYAQEHLNKSLNGRGQILEMIVDGQDVLVSPSGNYEEAIYAPIEFCGPKAVQRSRQRG